MIEVIDIDQQSLGGKPSQTLGAYRRRRKQEEKNFLDSP
jgi:hypothetical protein